MRWLSEHFQKRGKVGTVLDCGCGKGLWGYLIRTEQGGGARIIGFDVYLPYLKFCKTFRVYDDLLLASANRLPFRNKSVHLVLASELVEHLSRTEATAFLKETERVCRGRIILTTPNGPRRMGSWSSPTPRSEMHKSGWEASDLTSFKYKVYGLGFKWIKLTELYPIGSALHFIFTPFTYLIPRFAEFLMAVKDLQ